MFGKWIFDNYLRNYKHITDDLRDVTKDAHHYRSLNFVNESFIDVIDEKDTNYKEYRDIKDINKEYSGKIYETFEEIRQLNK